MHLNDWTLGVAGLLGCLGKKLKRSSQASFRIGLVSQGVGFFITNEMGCFWNRSMEVAVLDRFTIPRPVFVTHAFGKLVGEVGMI